MWMFTMGLFDGDPICRFCGMETETVQHIICCCEALARQRYHVFGRLIVEPKDISTASIRDFCLFVWDTGLLRLCWMKYWGCIIGLRLRRGQCIIRWVLRRRRRRRRTACEISGSELAIKMHAVCFISNVSYSPLLSTYNLKYVRQKAQGC